MAKRKKRKHRVSPTYQLFMSKPKKPSVQTKTEISSPRIDYKAFRSEMRQLYGESARLHQVKLVEPQKPKQIKKEYTPSKKKNRKKAKEKRRERKAKEKLQQEIKKVTEEPKVETYYEPEEDYYYEEPVTEPTPDHRTDYTPQFEEADQYINRMISLVESVQAQLDAKWAEKNIHGVAKGLDDTIYWLYEALNEPYDKKEEIALKLQSSPDFDRIESIVYLGTYNEAVDDIITITEEVKAIVESVA